MIFSLNLKLIKRCNIFKWTGQFELVPSKLLPGILGMSSPPSSSVDADTADRISHDFKLKKIPGFTGCASKQGKGPIILCFNDTAIPLKASAFEDRKQASSGLVVLNCLTPGYTKVPYSCGAGDKYKVHACSPFLHAVCMCAKREV